MTHALNKSPDGVEESGPPDAASGICCGPCSRLYAKLLEPQGPSNHSLLRKARFALSLTGLVVVFAVEGVAKDVYVEKFGLDPTIVGIIIVGMSFWSPVQDLLMGQLQDQQALAYCFPPSRWGRRAPWLLTHASLAAVAASVTYVPPSGVSPYVWLVLVKLAAMWGCCGSLIAFDAARQEIYPFTEERIVVEGLCKYTGMIGGAGGGLVVFVMLGTPAAFQTRLLLVAYTLLFALVGLVAVPVFREARSYVPSTGKASMGPGSGSASADAETISKSSLKKTAGQLLGTLNVLWEALPLSFRWLLQLCRRNTGARSDEKPANLALRHLLAMKFWNGAYFASIGTVLLYYVTYVLRLGKLERAFVLAGVGAAAGTTEVVMTLFYMWCFGQSAGHTDPKGTADRRLLIAATSFRVLHAGVTLVLIGLLPASVPLFVVWTVLSRICLSCFSFWRVSAQCWLVDEDCYGSEIGADGKAAVRGSGSEGRNMREGVVFSALAMCQNFSAAIFFSATFLGLGFAGLETKNCESLCQTSASSAFDLSASSCEEDCFRSVVDGQPDALRFYIRAVIGFWAPFCELNIAYHTFSFPIKGSRLRNLYSAVSAGRDSDKHDQQRAAQPLAAQVFGNDQGSASQFSPHAEGRTEFSGAMPVPTARRSSAKSSRATPKCLACLPLGSWH